MEGGGDGDGRGGDDVDRIAAGPGPGSVQGMARWAPLVAVLLPFALAQGVLAYRASVLSDETNFEADALTHGKYSAPTYWLIRVLGRVASFVLPGDEPPLVGRRLVLVAAGLGALAVADRIQRRLGARPWEAAAGTALLAVSPLMFEVAHVLKPQMLTVACQLGLVALSVRYWRDETCELTYAIGSVVLVGLALVVKRNVGIAFFPLLVAASVRARRTGGRLGWGLPLGLLAANAAFLAWLRHVYLPGSEVFDDPYFTTSPRWQIASLGAGPAWHKAGLFLTHWMPSTFTPVNALALAAASIAVLGRRRPRASAALPRGTGVVAAYAAHSSGTLVYLCNAMMPWTHLAGDACLVLTLAVMVRAACGARRWCLAAVTAALLANGAWAAVQVGATYHRFERWITPPHPLTGRLQVSLWTYAEMDPDVLPRLIPGTPVLVTRHVWESVPPVRETLERGFEQVDAFSTDAIPLMDAAPWWRNERNYYDMLVFRRRAPAADGPPTGAAGGGDSG